jgi:hypothetical protein
LNRAANRISFGGDIVQRAVKKVAEAAGQATTSQAAQNALQPPQQAGQQVVPGLIDILMKLFRP